jgi:hypothetical protein
MGESGLYPLTEYGRQNSQQAWKGDDMEIDEEKIDEFVLALLYLNFHGEHGATRAWKSFDWEAMDRLHKKGYISDPKSKAKSVIVTEEGKELARELFEKHFRS